MGPRMRGNNGGRGGQDDGDTVGGDGRFGNRPYGRGTDDWKGGTGGEGVGNGGGMGPRMREDTGGERGG